MTQWVLETDRITKRFADATAVDSLTMQIPQGAVCGFLGGNGAGKTTTLRILVGHLHPTAGAVRVFGIDPREHNEATMRRVAYVSDAMTLPGWMTPARAVWMNSRLFPSWNAGLAATLLTEFALTQSSPFRAMSKGQRQRLLLLLALCQGAELLIFDEPASGLDVESRQMFLSRVLDIACDGNATVLLSSHQLSDVERVVDRIVLLQHGQSIVQGGLDELKQSTRRLHIHAHVSESVLSEHFTLLRCEHPDEASTTATVASFSEQQMEAFRSALAVDVPTQVYELNLESLYLDFSQSSPTSDEPQSTPAMV